MKLAWCCWRSDPNCFGFWAVSRRWANVWLYDPVSVARQPAQRHVRWRHHHRGPGGPVQPQRPEVSVNAAPPPVDQFLKHVFDDLFLFQFLKARRKPSTWTSSWRGWRWCCSEYRTPGGRLIYSASSASGVELEPDWPERFLLQRHVRGRLCEFQRR